MTDDDPEPAEYCPLCGNPLHDWDEYGYVGQCNTHGYVTVEAYHHGKP